MQTFGLSVFLAARERSDQSWLEFLRTPSLSMGLYHLKSGEDHQQEPHTEDEVYYIIGGRAKFHAAGVVRAVEPGTILFVERFEEHSFFDITADLTALVFFAPAEGSSEEHPLAKCCTS
jgi:mannose-6-phosphate isomerase-like protein (cupin superfamily)